MIITLRFINMSAVLYKIVYDIKKRIILFDILIVKEL